MALPPELQEVLLGDTAQTWELIAPALPQELYLIGGTALAVHLHHRASRDLDFFFHERVDLDQLAATLQDLGPFAIRLRSEGTLNCLFSETKLQFLSAASQNLLEQPTEVAGVRVAGVGDIFATKLKVIADRGELRDYFDLMQIEQQAGRRVEEGLGLFMTRYQVPPGDATISHIVTALGYLEDVDEDDLVPVEKDVIEAYWRKRQPEIVRKLGRFSA
jgi:predicted nucleotidyltransferase component of viral defense system